MSDKGPTAETTIRMRLNGRDMAVDGSRARTIADLLRGACGLTGTKIGCETGECGACVILIEGEQALACLTPAQRADGRNISTIEHRDDPLLERLRRAFQVHGAAPCGFCAPGMLVTALDCLRRTPDATREQIADAIGGVHCRCGGRIGIIDAIQSAATGEAAKPAATGALHVGRREPRIDAQRQTEGAAAFGDDGAPAASLFVRAVRSPFARAGFAMADIDAWRAAHPGVAAVVTAADTGQPDGGVSARPLFAQDEARFRGELVAAIVGDHDAIARLTPEEFPVTWSPLPPLTDAARAAGETARPVDPRRPDNIAARVSVRRGHVAAGHAQGSVTVEGEFETGAAALAIASERGWAKPDGHGGIEIHVGARAAAAARDMAAALCRVPAPAIRIVPTPRAAGEEECDPAAPALLALACKVANAPVRFFCAPSEATAIGLRRPSRIRARASATSDGRLCAFEMRGEFSAGAFACERANTADLAALHAAGPYKIAHVRCRTRAILTNEPPAGFADAAGAIEAAIASEALIDELAERVGMDRWAFRRLNAIGHGDATATGQTLAASAGLQPCLDALKLDWEQAMWEAQMHNGANGDRYRRGVGVACLWRGCGGLSRADEQRVRLTLDRSGKLVFTSGVVDFGDGSLTALTQILADELGMPVDAFACAVDEAASGASPPHFHAVGRAAMLAARDMRRKIARLANVGNRARLSLKGRELHVQDGETRRVVDLGATAHEKGVVFAGEGAFSPAVTALDEDGQGTPFAAYSFGAQIAEVEVDMLLGGVKVLHVAAAQDVGHAINPLLIEGRIQGAVLRGIAAALTAETDPARADDPRCDAPAGAGQPPRITVRLIEDREPDGAFGAKSLGGSAIIATAPAVLNAVRHATGVTARRIPLRPDRLWEAIRLRGG